MIGWLLRLLLVLLLLRLVWQIVRGFVSSVGIGSRVERGGTLVRDPVCGTFVLPSRALRTRRRGTVHYFCSDACRRAFAERATGTLARR